MGYKQQQRTEGVPGSATALSCDGDTSSEGEEGQWTADHSHISGWRIHRGRATGADVDGVPWREDVRSSGGGSAHKLFHLRPRAMASSSSAAGTCSSIAGWTAEDACRVLATCLPPLPLTVPAYTAYKAPTCSQQHGSHYMLDGPHTAEDVVPTAPYIIGSSACVTLAFPLLS